MSDIVINNNHCALILSKEEATLIFAMVGRLVYTAVDGANEIYDTFHGSGFVSKDEYSKWWDSHALEARRDFLCQAGDCLPTDGVLLVRK